MNYNFILNSIDNFSNNKGDDDVFLYFSSILWFIKCFNINLEIYLNIKERE